MPRKNIPDAKNRILQAAIKVFAEKSFEGARIDEVAEAAKVPKSLIYYHFKSKEEILDVLINDFLQEYTALLQVAEHDTHQTKAEMLPTRISNHYKDFFIRNSDIIRILFMDSLKKSTETPVVFKVVEALVGAEKRFLHPSQDENYSENERLVAEFFSNIIPNFAYLCFGESWVRHFAIERQELDALFLKTIVETHGAYHKNHP